MTIRQSIRRSVRQSVRQSIIAGGGAVTTRFFTTLDGTADYYTIPSFAPATTFDFEIEFALTGTPSQEPISNFGRYLIRAESDTSIRIWGDANLGGEVNQTVPSLGNSLHSLKVSGTVGSGTLVIVLDGITYNPAGGNIPSFAGADFFLGRRSGGFFGGVFANSVITLAGTPSRSYAIDEDLSTTSTIVDSLDAQRFYTVLDGVSDRYETFPFTPSGDWSFSIKLSGEPQTTKVIYGAQDTVSGFQLNLQTGSGGDNDKIRIFSTGSSGNASANGTATVLDGSIHDIEISYILSTNTFTVKVDGVLDITLVAGSGFVMDFSSADEGFLGALGGSFAYAGILYDAKYFDNGTLAISYAINEDWVGPSTVLVDSISGQDGTAVNITSADTQFSLNNGTAVSITESEEFTLDGTDYLSNTELWTFGDSVSSGSEGTGATVNAGGSVVIADLVYRASGTASGVTSGSQRVKYGATSGTEISADGDFTDTQTATTSTTLSTVVGTSQSNSGHTLGSLSVKRLLEVA